MCQNLVEFRHPQIIRPFQDRRSILFVSTSSVYHMFHILRQTDFNQ